MNGGSPDPATPAPLPTGVPRPLMEISLLFADSYQARDGRAAIERRLDRKEFMVGLLPIDDAFSDWLVAAVAGTSVVPATLWLADGYPLAYGSGLIDHNSLTFLWW